MAVNINLYPPVVETYMPAFLVGSSDVQKNTCRVYFSISLYNSLSDIKNAQVTVANQNTNLSVLNKSKYPCEIMLTDIKTDLTRVSDDKYYIEIKTSDIEEGFQINQYYKVQIRFTAAGAANVDLTPPQAIDSWLAANLSNFSEWSTVCLVRGISVPSLSVSGFDISADTTLWSLNNVDVVGRLTYADSAETDTLKSYQIKLYDINNQLLSDSGVIYSNAYSNINEFNYTFEYAFNEGESYYFTFEYETANMYTESNTYEFMVVQEGADKLEATLTATLDNINGCIALHIESDIGQESFVGNITIRRTSSESNFTIWEDVHTESFEENSKLNYTWYDYTIKSGVYYKYIAQRRSSIGNRGIAIHAKGEPFMMLFDDMYLTGGDEQLNIRFDPSVSSFKRTVSESRTDTIGSKYPYIKRNGYVEYRQFPIGGTITHLMDPSHLITSREEIFRDNLDNYTEFNKDKNIRIDDFNDWTYEREFREKVMDFLYANKVRLFRSATEGNILVKIMDINLTPNSTLGRRIYSFTATAYEVDAATIKNYDKYGISPLGTYDTLLQFANDYVGQYNEVIPANTEALSLIQKKYEKYAKENYKIAIQNLDFLRLEFESDPYLIKEGEDGPYVVDDLGSVKENPNSAILGYLAYINNKPIIINPEGIYELKGENVEITSLSFPVDTQVNLEYHINLQQTEDTSKVFQTSSFYRRVGQRWGAFKPNDSIYQNIWNKYFEKYSNYQQMMLSLDGVKIEAEPGTVVFVKESADTDFERHVIGPTYTLALDAEDSAIEGLYFAGIHLEPATAAEQERETLPDNKYVETNIVLDKYVSDTSQLIKNGVYTLADDYLEVIDQFAGWYSIKSKEQWPEQYTASVNQDNIEHPSSSYTLLFDRVLQPIDDDGGLVVDEEWIEQVGGDVWTGSLYIDGTEDEEIETQNNLNHEEDLIPTGDRQYRDGVYTMKSREQWPDKSIASVSRRKVSNKNSTYILGLDRAYDDYYHLILNKEIDRQYALILQRLIDEANSRFIWHNDQWWLFTNNDDLLCPVEALIDYHCEIMKGRYAE